MPIGRPYSQHEDDFIRANYLSMPYRDIGVHLGRSTHAIAHRVCKLKLEPKMALRRWTADEDEAIRSRCGTAKLAEVARDFGRRKSEVSARAAQLGVTFRKPKRRFTKGGHVIVGHTPDGLRALLEHRVVMEQHLGRNLRSGEVVHHINTVKTDNRIDNLHLCDGPGEHQRAHRSLDKLVPDLLRRTIIRFDRARGVYELCETDN